MRITKNWKPPFQRFAEKIQVDPLTGCWVWTAGKDSDGYGVFKIDNKSYGAHRFSYMALVGQVPEGKQLDHYLASQGKCSTSCVNPDHLKAVTVKENINNRRTSYAVTGTCKRGHQMTPENTMLHSKDGHPRCRECWRIKDRKWKEANPEKVALCKEKNVYDPARYRVYYEKDKEVILQKARARRAANKDAINARRKESRALDPEKRARQDRAYREAKKQRTEQQCQI